MKKLLSFIACLFLLISSSANATTIEWIKSQTRGKISSNDAASIVSSVYKYSLKYDIDPNLLFRIMRVESNFNKKAVSSDNAIGLLQIIKKWHKKRIANRNLFDIDTNIDVGAQYLSELIYYHHGNINKALRAYNSSPRSNVYPTKVFAVILPPAEILVTKEAYISPEKSLENQNLLASVNDLVRMVKLE